MRVEGEHDLVWRGSARSDDVRRFNRRRVLRCVRRAGEISRTGVSEQTGLSPATVTAIASDLIGAGLLNEAVTPASNRRAGRGRPKTGLSLNACAASVAIANLQLDTITGAIIDYTGQTIGSGTCRIATRSASPEKLRAGLGSALQSALADAGRGRPPIGRVCVAAQGVTDVDGRRLTWSPITKPESYKIAQWIEDDFGVPADVRNDAGLAAIALNARTPETFSDDFAVVLLAHGVGMGLFLHGRLVSGGLSSGTEFGHMIHHSGGAKCRCGVSGCIEAYASDYAIVRRAAGCDVGALPPQSISEREIADVAIRAVSGDANARAALEEAGRAIGVGLASLFALVDPVPVVFAGSSATLQDHLEPAIRTAINEHLGPRLGEATNVGGRAAFTFLADADGLIQHGAQVEALSRLDDEFANAPL